MLALDADHLGPDDGEDRNDITLDGGAVLVGEAWRAMPGYADAQLKSRQQIAHRVSRYIRGLQPLDCLLAWASRRGPPWRGGRMGPIHAPGSASGGL